MSRKASPTTSPCSTQRPSNHRTCRPAVRTLPITHARLQPSARVRLPPRPAATPQATTVPTSTTRCSSTSPHLHLLCKAPAATLPEHRQPNEPPKCPRCPTPNHIDPSAASRPNASARGPHPLALAWGSSRCGCLEKVCSSAGVPSALCRSGRPALGWGVAAPGAAPGSAGLVR